MSSKIILDSNLDDLIRAIKNSALLVAVLWAVHIYSELSHVDLRYWGIYPREADGLLGIFTAPLIHGSWEHLFSNSAPLFVSMVIIHYFYQRVAMSSFILIYILTGIAVWFFGRSVYHIGASGIVYGLIAFIFWSGVFRRNIKSIVLSLIVTIMYVGYLEGIVPFQEGISWESHLMGLLVGVIISFLLKGVIEKDEVQKEAWVDEVYEDAVYFLPRDIFDKTLEERKREEELRRLREEDSNDYFLR